MDTDVVQKEEDNLIELILKLMKEVEKSNQMSGEEKKKYVLECVKSQIGENAYEVFQYFIEKMIDFVISVSKGQTKLDFNIVKKSFFCCK